MIFLIKSDVSATNGYKDFILFFYDIFLIICWHRSHRCGIASSYATENKNLMNRTVPMVLGWIKFYWHRDDAALILLVSFAGIFSNLSQLTLFLLFLDVTDKIFSKQYSIIKVY